MTFNVLILGVVSIPNESISIISKGFFLAFIIFGKEAKRGVLSLKSHVRTAGKLVSKFSIPSSISLEIETLLPSIFKFEIKQPCGQLVKQIEFGQFD